VHRWVGEYGDARNASRRTRTIASKIRGILNRMRNVLRGEELMVDFPAHNKGVYWLSF